MSTRSPTLPHLPDRRLTSFLGRDDEIAQVVDLLATRRLVTLLGPGGVGKTRLAEAVLHRLADDDGGAPVAWVELGPLSGAELMVDAIADVTGCPTPGGDIDVLTDELRGQRLLLALDNAEHLVEPVAHTVATLLSRCPEATALVTSREVLAVEGEVVVTVHPLGEQTARQLFVDRQALVAHPPATVDDPDIGRICGRLDRLPLAIELAAARSRTLSPAQIADALEDRFALLTGGARTAVARQQTLEASVAWSIDLLDGEERRALLALSVFSAPFTMQAATAVLDGIVTTPATTVLLDLADKSLLSPAEGVAGEPAHRLLETIRAYTRTLLTDAADTATDTARPTGLADRARANHARWVRDLCATFHTEHRTERVGTAMRRLAASIADVQDVMAHHRDEGRWTEIIDLLADSLYYWQLRHGMDEPRRAIREALETIADPTSPNWRKGARLLAHLAFPDFEDAARWATKVIAAAPANADGDPDTDTDVVLAHANRLWADRALGRRAHTDALKVLDAARRLDDPGAADDAAWWTLGSLLYTDALRWREVVHDELLAARRRGDLLGESEWIALQFGAWQFAADPARAEALALRAHELADLMGMPLRTRHSMRVLLMLRRGRYDAARAYVTRLEEIHDATPFYQQGPTRLWDLRDLIAFATGEQIDDDALDLPAFEDVVPAVRAYVMTSVAVFLAAAGRTSEALARLDGALADGPETAISWTWPIALVNRLWTLRLAGAPFADAAHETLLAAHEQESMALPDALEAVAAVDAAGDRHDRAVRLMAAADRIRAQHGVRRFRRWDGHVDDVLTASRAALGGDAFDAAWRAGLQMDVDDAVALARTGRDERPVDGWDALTPAEQETAKLAAEGLSNPDIAERLFISRNTVKTHLSAAYRKLGVGNRTALAGTIQERTARGSKGGQ